MHVIQAPKCGATLSAEPPVAQWIEQRFPKPLVAPRVDRCKKRCQAPLDCLVTYQEVAGDLRINTRARISDATSSCVMKPAARPPSDPARRRGLLREVFDGASRTRTGDLLGAIQALSQLSYSPEGCLV
jgi:hypothetical protein